MTSQLGTEDAPNPSDDEESDLEETVTRPPREESGLAWLIPTTMVLVSLILGLVLWQCSDPSSGAAAPTAENGLIAYREAGCAACHGQTGLGGSGPALGGYQATEVIRQVRAPFRAMPMFTQNQVSDNDLAAIVKFIEGLEPVERTIALGIGPDPRDALAAHHRLALTAIQNGDVAETIHQIDHINAFIGGEHLDAMKNITDLLDQGEISGAELRLANMSAGDAPEPAFLDSLNLALATQALVASDSAEAIRHLDAAADGAVGTLAVQARQTIDAGAPDDAAELLIETLGADALGIVSDSEG